MDGPVPPNRWVIEDGVWPSRVSEDILELCTRSSSSCKSYLTDMGQLPQLVFDAIRGS